MVGLGAVISVMTSCQLCCCSTEADIDNMQMKGRDACVPGGVPDLDRGSKFAEP